MKNLVLESSLDFMSNLERFSSSSPLCMVMVSACYSVLNYENNAGMQ